MKTCKRCGEMKDETAFHRAYTRHDGSILRMTICKVCAVKKARDYYWATAEKNRPGYAEKQRRRREQNLDSATRKKRDLLKKYGMSVEEWDRIFEQQGGCCAICAVDLTATYKVCVDHDHETGAVRGLLCSICNQGLGLFKDDQARLLRAAAYLLSAEGAPVART